jgi:iron complex outermembrane receptor protein
MKNRNSCLHSLASTTAQIAVLASFSLWSGSAHSQATPSRSTPDKATAANTGTALGAEENSVADIIVTAQKRNTFIQDTPIAMSAFQATELRRADISDVTGLTRLAPDLRMSQVNSFVQLSVRGITSLDTSPTGDPELTVSIDGEYINRGIAINAALFDLARVEVLRGPQGTLYGRNAVGGAIDLIAAKPEFTPVNGFVTAGYGNYKAKQLEAAINLPVSDTLAFRVGGFHKDHDGYRDNGQAGRGDDGNISAVRVSALFKPNDRLTAYVAGEYNNVDQTGVAQYGVLVTSATPGLVPYTNPDNPTQSSFIPAHTVISDNGRSFPVDTNGYYKSQQYAVRGRLDYDFGPAKLSYIGAYRAIRSSQYQNADGLAPNGDTHFAVLTPKQDSDTQSHEIRLSSAASSPIIWQAGAFYFRETLDLVQGLYSPNFVAGPGLPANPVLFFTRFRPDFVSTSKAVFAQTTIPIIKDVLSVTGGVRYTDDEKTSSLITCPFNFAAYLSGTNRSAPAQASCPGRTEVYQRATGSKVTWLGGIDWHPAPDHLIYGKVSTGYKSGGFDIGNSFGPETLTAYEIGSKNRFFDRRLTFNLAAFYYEFKNQQVQVLIDLNGGFKTQNAGASRVYGLETSSTFQLSSDDRFSLTANYLNAKYTKYIGQYGTVSGVVYPADLSGTIPPLSPKFTVAAGYDHIFHIGELGTLTASALTHYTSSYFLAVTNWDGTKVGRFTKTDLGLEYATPDKSLTVQVYVHNLENNIVHTYANYIANPGEYTFNYSEPRTFGIRATKHF